MLLLICFKKSETRKTKTQEYKNYNYYIKNDTGGYRAIMSQFIINVLFKYLTYVLSLTISLNDIITYCL